MAYQSDARPLIGKDRVSVPMINGLQRLAILAPIYADEKLEPYEPQKYRD